MTNRTSPTRAGKLGRLRAKSLAAVAASLMGLLPAAGRADEPVPPEATQAPPAVTPGTPVAGQAAPLGVGEVSLGTNPFDAPVAGQAPAAPLGVGEGSLGTNPFDTPVAGQAAPLGVGEGSLGTNPFDGDDLMSKYPWGLNEGGDPAFAAAIGNGPLDPFKAGRAARDAQGGPLGFAGRVPFVPGDVSGSDFFTVDDRWRVSFPSWDRYVRGLPYDPYHQNVLKGDYPIFGTQDIFFNFTGISDQFYESRQLPAKIGTVYQNVYNQNIFTEFDLFKGNNTFHPSDWFLRFTPALNIHDNTGVGTTTDFAVQELFGDVQLGIISPYYDTMDLRVGRQGIDADFRGFLFVDVNNAVRLFGNADNNIYQYQVFALDNSLKNPVSQLNTFNPRKQELVGGTIIQQDFVFKGLNALAGILYDHDDYLHEVDAAYLEVAVDGHIGRLLVDAAFIQGLGHDNDNPITGRSETLNGQFGALELAVPFDWLTPKVSALVYSGDSANHPGQARGFDPVFDNPQFAGDGFSYLGRENLKPGGVPLVNVFSFVPDMRDKFAAPVNFVNPGLVLLNTGVNAALTTRMNVQTNLNFYEILDPEPLEIQLEKTKKLSALPHIGRELGVEPNMAIQYNPLIIPNALFTLSGSVMFPGETIKDMTGSSSTLFMGFAAVTLFF